MLLYSHHIGYVLYCLSLHTDCDLYSIVERERRDTVPGDRTPLLGAGGAGVGSPIPENEVANGNGHGTYGATISESPMN